MQQNNCMDNVWKDGSLVLKPKCEPLTEYLKENTNSMGRGFNIKCPLLTIPLNKLPDGLYQFCVKDGVVSNCPLGMWTE